MKIELDLPESVIKKKGKVTVMVRCGSIGVAAEGKTLKAARKAIVLAVLEHFGFPSETKTTIRD